jgi:hypothetical protein
MLAANEAERLRVACAERASGARDASPYSADGRAVYPLLTAPHTGTPPPARGRPDSTSPPTMLDTVGEPRDLVEALADHSTARLIEFTGFR